MRALTALLACATNTYALDPSLRHRWRDAPIAQVTGGRVRGTTKDNVTAFYGVPYAKAKRYAAAAPTSWSGIRDATAPAPPCPQMAHGVIGHEDCLVANVFTPAGNLNLPIMLQIHGGSMNAGRAVADGSALAKRAKAIIVSIQYRLGALGFWACLLYTSPSPRD